AATPAKRTASSPPPQSPNPPHAARNSCASFPLLEQTPLAPTTCAARSNLPPAHFCVNQKVRCRFLRASNRTTDRPNPPITLPLPPGSGTAANDPTPPTGGNGELPCAVAILLSRMK